MTRFDEIKNYALQAEFDYATPIDAFIRGALWADRNPDKRKIYTKQELKDMGFSFNLDGDIIIPTKSNKTTEKSNKTTEKSYKLNVEQSIEETRDWFQNLDL